MAIPYNGGLLTLVYVVYVVFVVSVVVLFIDDNRDN